MESRRSGVERASLASMDSRPGLPAVQLLRLRPFSISIFSLSALRLFFSCWERLFLLRAAISKGGVPDSSPLKTLFLFFLLLGGRSGLQGFCYSLYFLGAVDVLYALDVLCEMQGLAWVGCRFFVLHWFSLRSILECWETGNFVGRMMECGMWYVLSWT